MRALIATSEKMGGLMVEALIRAGHQVVGVVSPRRGIYRHQGSGWQFWPMYLRGWDVEKACRKFGVPLRVSNKLEEGAMKSFIKSQNIDLLVVLGWPNLIPDAVLALFRFGGMNIHPSLLPKLRGPDPLFALLDGDLEGFGISFHRMVAELDAGPVYHQVPLKRKAGQCYDDLYRSVLYGIHQNLATAVARMETNPAGVAQAGVVTQARPFRRRLTILDPNGDARKWQRRALACCSHHRMFTAVDSRVISFQRMEPFGPLGKAKEGAVLQAGFKTLVVAMKGQAMRLSDARVEGVPRFLGRLLLKLKVKPGTFLRDPKSVSRLQNEQKLLR